MPQAANRKIDLRNIDQFGKRGLSEESVSCILGRRQNAVFAFLKKQLIFFIKYQLTYRKCKLYSILKKYTSSSCETVPLFLNPELFFTRELIFEF
jgi:hypothetical protein